MANLIKKMLLIVAVLFVLPVSASVMWWLSVDRPASWHEARWDATGFLPAPSADRQAAVYIMAARTGGLKGALSIHTWIVIKPRDARRYDRYDKVGWGLPVRKNAYAADARWYSNSPRVLKAVHGRNAERLIPKIEAAIRRYPHADRGDYQIWPGPNSNSFVAYVLREVDELDLVLPPHAVGRDYLAGGKLVHISADWHELHASLHGMLGVSLGLRSGIEVQLLGLVAGIDIAKPAIKLPGFGRIGFDGLDSL